MQISLENLSGLERKLTVTVPAEKVEQETLSRLHKLAPKAKIPGFRPGKVPFTVLQQRFGDTARDEAVGQLLQESYLEALKQEKLNPAGFPRIEITNAKVNEPLTFTATFEIYPEFKLADLSNCEINKYVSEVTENDVNDMLQKLSKEHVTWKEITNLERTAQREDQLTVDFSVHVHSDKPSEPKLEKDVKFVLGSGFMWSEFEAPLYKAKAGDEVKFTLKFPLTHRDKELIGKHADFVVKVHKVCEPIYPELNDEFAKKLGIKANGIEGLRKEVKTNMERDLQDILKSLFKAAILEKLYDANPIEVPQVLIAQELKAMQERWQQNYASMAKNLQAPEFPRAEYEDRAKRFVTLGLLLAAVIKEHNLKVESQELKAKVEELASIYEDAPKVVNWYFGNKDRMLEVESSLLEDKSINTLAQQIKIVEKPISYKDAIARRGARE